jgi:hypothetical protein
MVGLFIRLSLKGNDKKMMKNEDFKSLLNNVMDKYSLSKSDLVSLIGVSDTTFRLWLNGDSTPNPYNLERLIHFSYQLRTDTRRFCELKTSDTKLVWSMAFYVTYAHSKDALLDLLKEERS